MHPTVCRAPLLLVSLLLQIAFAATEGHPSLTGARLDVISSRLATHILLPERHWREESVELVDDRID